MSDKQAKTFVILYTLYAVGMGMIVGMLVYAGTDTERGTVYESTVQGTSVKTENPQLRISGGELQPAAKVENINWDEVQSWR